MPIANRPLLSMPVRYALCLSRKDYRRTMKDLGLRDPGDAWMTDGKSATCHQWMRDEPGGPACIVCMKPPNDVAMSQIAGLLVHESVHIWQVVRADMGESQPSSEFEAYAIQNIAQELIEIYLEEIG